LEADNVSRNRGVFFAVAVAAALAASLGAGLRPAAAQALPDLIVRTDTLEEQWVVRDERLGADFCSVIEGGVQPGLRRLLRFTVSTANIGAADVHIGDPAVHFAAGDGLFEFAACHHHFHFRNYAVYELIEPATGRVWKAAKRGFCMLDTDPNPTSMGGDPPRNPKYRNCGDLTHAGDQGITHGWSDTYRFTLGGQYFVLDGGDNQPPVPPGNYVIRITANPPFKAKGNQACPALDLQGFCHNFAEADYSNNVGEVAITIPQHVGRGGAGPLAGTDPEPETAEH
jgi:hypothetical protein